MPVGQQKYETCPDWGATPVWLFPHLPFRFMTLPLRSPPRPQGGLEFLACERWVPKPTGFGRGRSPVGTAKNCATRRKRFAVMNLVSPWGLFRIADNTKQNGFVQSCCAFRSIRSRTNQPGSCWAHTGPASRVGSVRGASVSGTHPG